jgi:peroxiredoxin
MKSLSYTLFSLFGFLLIFSCGSALQKGTVVKGNLSDGENLQVFFDLVHLSKTQVMAKDTASANGDFEMVFENGLDAGIYRIRVGAKRAYLFLDGSEKTMAINTNIDALSKYDFVVEGSTAATNLVQNMAKLIKRELKPADLVQLIEQTENPIEAMHYALGVSPSAGNLPLLKKVANRLDAAYPESEYATLYRTEITQLEKQIARQQAQETIRVGQPAPDISLPNPDGTTMALSDLKGQVVLLDFWASWCGPCRKANPHVVKAYNKYKDKGFTVYSVSLDRPGQKARWINAIEQDKLSWPYHVSDLKYWNSAPAATYGVRGIPKTFLIDKAGKIVSTSISPYALDQALEKLL